MSWSPTETAGEMRCSVCSDVFKPPRSCRCPSVSAATTDVNPITNQASEVVAAVSSSTPLGKRSAYHKAGPLSVADCRLLHKACGRRLQAVAAAAARVDCGMRPELEDLEAVLKARIRGEKRGAPKRAKLDKAAAERAQFKDRIAYLEDLVALLAAAPPHESVARNELAKYKVLVAAIGEEGKAIARAELAALTAEKAEREKVVAEGVSVLAARRRKRAGASGAVN